MMGSMLAALLSLALSVLGSATILVGVLEPAHLAGASGGQFDVGLMAAPSQLTAGPMV